MVPDKPWFSKKCRNAGREGRTGRYDPGRFAAENPPAKRDPVKKPIRHLTTGRQENIRRMRFSLLCRNP
jgi:hypothetical protein